MSVYFVPIPSYRFFEVLEQYEEQFESSTKISRFFQLLKIRFGKLSTKQQKTFQLFFGCLDEEGFFKNGDFIGLFKTILKPLYAQYPHSLQLHYVNHQEEHIHTAMEVLELGQLFVELFLPRNLSDFEYISRLNDAGISDEAGHKAIIYLLVRRKTFLSCQELVDVEVKFKEVFRDGYETEFFCEVLREFISSNPNICTFLWYHCDICGKKIQSDTVNDEIRKCTDCGGPCVLLPELTPSPRPTSPAQASDPIQALATEITTAKISFGEKSQEIANVLLENGVYQLSKLSVLNQSEFESLVKKLELNTLQLQSLRVASGRQ